MSHFLLQLHINLEMNKAFPEEQLFLMSFLYENFRTYFHLYSKFKD